MGAPFLDDDDLDPARIELLVEGDRSWHPRTAAELHLQDLVASLQAPARPGELDGERAATAAFTAQHVPRRPMAVRPVRPGRRVAAATAIAGSLVAVTALSAAATTGALPAPLQRIAHSLLGAPDHHATATAQAAPTADPIHRRTDPTTSPTDPTRPDARSSSNPTMSAGTGGGRAGTPTTRPLVRAIPPVDGHLPTPPDAKGLCRAWQAQGGDPKGHGLRRQLTALAEGTSAVADYCHDVLGTGAATPSPRATPPGKANGHGKPTDKATAPGKANGHAKGHGPATTTTSPGRAPVPGGDDDGHGHANADGAKPGKRLGVVA